MAILLHCGTGLTQGCPQGGIIAQVAHWEFLGGIFRVYFKDFGGGDFFKNNILNPTLMEIFTVFVQQTKLLVKN